MDYRIYITAFLLWIVPNVSAEDCYTPDTIPGFCINLRNCESVLQVIYKYNQQKDPALVGFVQRSICGYDGYDILVCCPSSRYQTTTLPPFYFYSFTAAPISVPPQNQFSNFGPTFAPLGTPPVYTTPPPTFNPQPPTFPTQQPGFPTAPPVFPTAPPPISVPPVTNALPSFENDKCGVTNATHSRLVGGMPAQMNSWPWIALLGYSSTDGGPSFLCGGTLITQKHVLTAAHCIKATLYMVRLAEHDLSTTTELQSLDVPIELKIVHEKFDPKIIYNDIALLKLSQIVPISNTIRPICLPWSDEMRRRDYTYYNPFLAGWGATSYKGSSANILQEVQLPILPMSECQVNYKTHFPDQIFDDTVLCVGYPNGGKDSCQGDSGGPLMLPQLSPDGSVYYFNLIGIVSYGYECARPGFPGIYTRVTTFIPWITQHVND